ncbi:hypothetical protein ACFL54_02315 [Planctomycetota bacterium]
MFPQHRLGDFAAAQDMFQKGLELAEILGSLDKGAGALHCIGTFFFKKGQGKQALPVLHRSLDLYEQAGSPKKAEVEDLIAKIQKKPLD